MDYGTLFGMITAIGMVMLGILSNQVGIQYYVEISSVFIVVGGSIGGVLISSPLRRILGFGKYLSLLLNSPKYNEGKIITNLTSYAERARREGLLALEDILNDVEDEFMRQGIRLVVDGTDPEVIKSILYTELNQINSRHEDGIQLFGTWGTLAPAFGMIGTLIGLIAMLANLDDSSGIASGMATALITTLYGSLLANIVMIPFKIKLSDRDKYETRVKEITIEGILSIQSGDNPRILLDKLLSYLSPKERESIRSDYNQD